MSIYDHHLHGVFANQKSRCFSKNNKQYPSYGGRGIVISDEFKDNFLLWYNYVMSLPNAAKKSHSIDRINNDKGYERGNMRWATYYQQATNKRKYKCNTSGYVGVSEVPIITKKPTDRKQKWRATIIIDYKTKNLGAFDTPKQAVKARNKYIKANHLIDYKIQRV